MDMGFAGVILIKKAGDAKLASGCWDSIHVIDVMVSDCAAPPPHPTRIRLWITRSTQLRFLELVRGSSPSTATQL
ncbi:unnamed protein product [Echinostoma caproni]|uniref:F-actin-capping protein subunit beta n=1 Tax=Echinostoma caproni TaxID=27848 RepID=A0A183A233_9TREM|nr:unnamed protein product [Echinostoma caproni]